MEVRVDQRGGNVFDVKLTKRCHSSGSPCGTNNRKIPGSGSRFKTRRPTPENSRPATSRRDPPLKKKILEEIPQTLRNRTHLAKRDSESDTPPGSSGFPKLPNRRRSFSHEHSLNIAISSPSILPFVEGRLASTTRVPRARCKTATLCTHNHHHEKEKCDLPKIESTTAAARKAAKIISRAAGASQISFARLKNANLLNSPYLRCLKGVLEVHWKTVVTPTYESSTTREKSRAPSRQKVSPHKSDEKLPKLDKSKSIVVMINTNSHPEDPERDRVLNAFTNTRLADPDRDQDAYNKYIEMEKIMEGYKNFKSQTNITAETELSLPPKGTTSLNISNIKRIFSRPPTPSKVVRAGSANSQSSKGDSSAPEDKMPKRKVMTTTLPKPTLERPPTPSSIIGRPKKVEKIGVLMSPPGTPAVKKYGRRSGANIDRMRSMCQQYDRTNQWSTEIRNYYEWNTFCLLRKYRHDTRKLKEQIRLLGTDKYDIDQLWNDAEDFHDVVQHRRAKAAESHGKPSSTTPKTTDNGGTSPSPSGSTRDSAITSTIKPSPIGSRSQRRCSSATKEYLVPPPKSPDLSFLVPHLFHGPNKVAASPKSVQVTTHDVANNFNRARSRTNRVDKNIRKIQFAHDGSAVEYEHDLSSHAKNLNKSDILEIVTSYIPEAKPRSKLRIHNERVSFVHLGRGTTGLVK